MSPTPTRSREPTPRWAHRACPGLGEPSSTRSDYRLVTLVNPTLQGRKRRPGSRPEAPFDVHEQMLVSFLNDCPTFKRDRTDIEWSVRLSVNG